MLSNIGLLELKYLTYNSFNPISTGEGSKWPNEISIPPRSYVGGGRELKLHDFLSWTFLHLLMKKFFWYLVRFSRRTSSKPRSQQFCVYEKSISHSYAKFTITNHKIWCQIWIQNDLSFHLIYILLMCDQFWIFNYRCLHSVNFANVVKDVKDVIGLNDVTNVNNVNDVVTVKNIPMEIIIIIIISIPSTISMISIASMMSMSNANFSRSDLVTLAPRHGQSMQHRMGFKVSTGR